MPTMHQDWIAPIAGFAGVLVGGGIAILNNYVSSSRQEKQKRREEKLKHIEEIFDSIDKVENGLIYFYTNQTCAMLQGKVESLPHQTDIPLSRLELLIKLYFPILASSFAQLTAARDRCGGHFGSALVSLAKKESQQVTLEAESVIQELKGLSKQCEEMRGQVIRLAGKK
jgi:hypothetical protein